MTDKKNASVIMACVFLGCTVMGFVDAVLAPGYLIKSAVKILLFCGLALVCRIFCRDIRFLELFQVKKKTFWLSLLLGVGLYALILGAYFTIGSFFDLSNITQALTAQAGVDAGNFVFVAVYISFVNSLLEEFFFRGLAFLSLRKFAGRRAAYLFSSLLFALYHVAMMTSWFSVWLFLLLIGALFAGGMIFNRLDEKSGSIYTSWFVHMFANFAINTVGFILFGIIG